MFSSNAQASRYVIVSFCCIHWERKFLMSHVRSKLRIDVGDAFMMLDSHMRARHGHPNITQSPQVQICTTCLHNHTTSVDFNATSWQTSLRSEGTLYVAFSSTSGCKHFQCNVLGQLTSSWDKCLCMPLHRHSFQPNTYTNKQYSTKVYSIYTRLLSRVMKRSQLSYGW